MDPSCLVSTVQAGGGGVMVWGIFSWHTLGPLVPTEHGLNTTAYLSIVAESVHPFMTTVYPSSDGYDNEFTVLQWPPQSPDLSPIEHLWDVVEREILIMDQLCDVIMSIWTNISEECFQHLAESMTPRIKVKAKPGTSEVYQKKSGQ
ncbi:hypothetical protein P3386_23865 [Vibrio parahaemolyticus]|nr:hypothetical protein [Vibrio parahaemolyticus]